MLHHFHRGIQCDKTCNFVHGKAFEVNHEMQIPGVELKKTHKIYYECSISSVCHQSYVFDESVIISINSSATSHTDVNGILVNFTKSGTLNWFIILYHSTSFRSRKLINDKLISKQVTYSQKQAYRDITYRHICKTPFVYTRDVF